MKRIYSIILLSLILCFTLAGCQKAPIEECPFSDLSWKSSVEDVISAEGKEYTTYDSTYNGLTYSFPKTYMDQEGTLKYMFDDNDNLMSIAWSCSIDSDNLKNIYDKIHEEIVRIHGESGYESASPTNYGDVWYLDGGNVILSAVSTDTQSALQYGYLNPEVSSSNS